MRVERDGVGGADAGERAAAALGQDGEAAVRGVDVEPQSVFAAHLAELGQWVNGARVRRAAVRRDEERRPARAPVGRDRAPQRLGREARVFLRGKDADLVRPEAEDATAAGKRRVRLV